MNSQIIKAAKAQEKRERIEFYNKQDYTFLKYNIIAINGIYAILAILFGCLCFFASLTLLAQIFSSLILLTGIISVGLAWNLNFTDSKEDSKPHPWGRNWWLSTPFPLFLIVGMNACIINRSKWLKYKKDQPNRSKEEQTIYATILYLKGTHEEALGKVVSQLDKTENILSKLAKAAPNIKNHKSVEDLRSKLNSQVFALKAQKQEILDSYDSNFKALDNLTTELRIAQDLVNVIRGHEISKENDTFIPEREAEIKALVFKAEQLALNSGSNILETSDVMIKSLSEISSVYQ